MGDCRYACAFFESANCAFGRRGRGCECGEFAGEPVGEMFSNVSDFDGKTTFGARDFGGDGEFLVRVGTENRMQVLGHISLLGYSGLMIHPLCSGGPSESALGDAQEVTMAEWAQQCIDQGGLVVMPTVQILSVNARQNCAGADPRDGDDDV